MLATLPLTIDSSHGSISFGFSKPLHVVTFAISADSGEIAWKLLPDTFAPADNAGGLFWNIPLRPPHDAAIVNALGVLDSNEWLPTVKQIVYGRVPIGYKATQHASPLRDGDQYHAVFIAIEGHGAAAFTPRGGELCLP